MGRCYATESPGRIRFRRADAPHRFGRRVAGDQSLLRGVLRCGLAAGILPRAAGDADPYWPSQTLLRGGREVDPIENLSRYHYLKELYLDSATNMCVLSAVP